MSEIDWTLCYVLGGLIVFILFIGVMSGDDYRSELKSPRALEEIRRKDSQSENDGTQGGNDDNE